MGYSARQTTDGGFVIAGYTHLGVGPGDVYLNKTDLNGNALWTKTFGGIEHDQGYPESTPPTADT